MQRVTTNSNQKWTFVPILAKYFGGNCETSHDLPDPALPLVRVELVNHTPEPTPSAVH